MPSAGMLLITVGYAMLWTGVNRFRKLGDANNKAFTLFEALGLTKVPASSGNTGTGNSVKPSSDTTSTTPSTTGGTPLTGGTATSGTGTISA